LDDGIASGIYKKLFLLICLNQKTALILKTTDYFCVVRYGNM